MFALLQLDIVKQVTECVDCVQQAHPPRHSDTPVPRAFHISPVFTCLASGLSIASVMVHPRWTTRNIQTAELHEVMQCSRLLQSQPDG